MDMLWRQNPPLDGFLLDGTPSGFEYLAGPSFGLAETGDLSRWQVIAIPEPASIIVWSLLGAIGLRGVRRKNRIGQFGVSDGLENCQ